MCIFNCYKCVNLLWVRECNFFWPFNLIWSDLIHRFFWWTNVPVFTHFELFTAFFYIPMYLFFFFRLMISRCACCLWLCETDWKIFTCCKLIIVVVPFTFIMIFLIVFLVKVNIFKVFIVFIFVVVYKTSTVDCQINWLRIVIWQKIALVTIVSTLQVYYFVEATVNMTPGHCRSALCRIHIVEVPFAKENTQPVLTVIWIVWSITTFCLHLSLGKV